MTIKNLTLDNRAYLAADLMPIQSQPIYSFFTTDYYLMLFFSAHIFCIHLVVKVTMECQMHTKWIVMINKRLLVKSQSIQQATTEYCPQTRPTSAFLSFFPLMLSMCPLWCSVIHHIHCGCRCPSITLLINHLLLGWLVYVNSGWLLGVRLLGVWCRIFWIDEAWWWWSLRLRIGGIRGRLTWHPDWVWLKACVDKLVIVENDDILSSFSLFLYINESKIT